MKMLFYLLLPICLLFNLSNNSYNSSFLGAAELKWPACATQFAGVAAISTSCESELISTKGAALRVEYSAKGKADFRLKSVKDNQVYRAKRLYKAKSDQEWNVIEFAAPSQDYTLISSGLLNIRSRVSFFSGQPLSSNALRQVFLISLVILSMLIATQALELNLKNKWKQYLYFLVLSLTAHFRTDLYFYFDEWTLLNVFQDQSILTYRHNEHYLPLFFSFLKFETKLFGMNYWLYLLTSNLIHALNALIIYRLVRRIFPDQKSIANIVAIMFTLSALHAESLHWAFEQSLLLCSSLVLISTYSALKYFDTAEIKPQLIAIATAAISPFVFGNGFSVVFVIALFWLLSFPKLSFGRLVKVLLPIILCFGSYSLFYFSNSQTPVAELDHKFLRIISYIFVGSQHGVVLRGLGLYPSLNLDLASKLLPDFRYPELVFAAFGLLIGATCFFFAYRQRPQAIKIFIVGFMLPIVTIALPALTRWHLGTAQSLSLRYSYLGVFGLFLMLAPVLSLLLKKRTFLKFLLTAIIILQIRLEHNFRYFSDNGIKHKDYVESLINWKCTNLGRELMPLHPQSISPGFNQDLILKAASWLDKDLCD